LARRWTLLVDSGITNPRVYSDCQASGRFPRRVISAVASAHRRASLPIVAGDLRNRLGRGTTIWSGADFKASQRDLIERTFLKIGSSDLCNMLIPPRNFNTLGLPVGTQQLCLGLPAGASAPIRFPSARPARIAGASIVVLGGHQKCGLFSR